MEAIPVTVFWHIFVIVSVCERGRGGRKKGRGKEEGRGRETILNC